MAGRLFGAVEGISSGDDEPPILEQSLPPPPNRMLALPRAQPPTRSTKVESEAPTSSNPDTSEQRANSNAASDAKSWLKPNPRSQSDVFKTEAAASAKAIQSGKVGAVHTYTSASCGRGRGRGRGRNGRSTSSVASSSLPTPSLPTNDDEAASPAPTVRYQEDGIGGTHSLTTARPMTHAGRFCPESGCDSRHKCMTVCFSLVSH